MRRLFIIRDVNKEGEYTRHYGVRRWFWYIDETTKCSPYYKSVKYKVLVISIGTRDIIIAYRRWPE